MIEFGLPFAEYTAIQAVNWSSLKHMDKSPKAYAHYKAKGIPDSVPLRVGRAAHCAILEPEVFEADYVVWHGRRQGNAWEAFKDEHAERPIISESEYNKALAIREAFLRDPRCKDLLEDSTGREVTISWEDEETGLACKARPDLMTDAVLLDLKTTGDSSPRWFWRTAANLYYYSQLAWYLDSLRNLDARRRTPMIAAMEINPPHDVTLFRIPEDLISIGRRHYRALLNRVAECEKSKRWPGAAPETVDLHIPDGWLTTGVDEPPIEITVGGSPVAL